MIYGFMTGFLAALSALALVGFFLAIFRVEEGHVAVLTRFGALNRNAQNEVRLYSSGLHWKLPWEKVHEFSLMERMIKVGGEERTLEVLARDGTILRVDGRARFRFRSEGAEKFIFGLRSPIQHLNETFRGIIGEEIGRFGTPQSENGSYSELRKDRVALDEAISRRVEALRARYGIELRAVDIAEILPPADLAEALNGIQKVKAQYETLRNRVAAECERKIVSAEHGVEIARIRGEAAEKEIRVLGEAVCELEKNGSLDAYLRRRRDEASFAARAVYMKS